MDDIQPREPKDVLTVFIMKCFNEMGCTWANAHDSFMLQKNVSIVSFLDMRIYNILNKMVSDCNFQWPNLNPSQAYYSGSFD